MHECHDKSKWGKINERTDERMDNGIYERIHEFMNSWIDG